MNSEYKYRLHLFLTEKQKDKFEELYQNSESILGSNERKLTHEEALKQWMNYFQEINFGKESLKKTRVVNLEGNIDFSNDPSTHECIFCERVHWLFSPTPRGALCIDCAFIQAHIMGEISERSANKMKKKMKEGKDEA